MDETPQWYVLRDLSRPNAKLSAFEKLTGRGVRCFTPMVKKPIERRGKHGWKDVPYIRDLLFAHSTRDVLDPFMRPGLKLQYRYIYGGFMEPMTVREADMERFILAVTSSVSSKYYRPEEITPAMRNRRIRIIGGPLRGQSRHRTRHHRETPVGGTADAAGRRRGGGTGIHTILVSEKIRNKIFTPHFIFVSLLLHIMTWRNGV